MAFGLKRMDVSQKVDIATEAAKAAPPVAVVGTMHIMGYTLNDWVMIGTAVYLVLQTAFLIRKWYLLEKGKALNDPDDK